MYKWLGMIFWLHSHNYIVYKIYVQGKWGNTAIYGYMLIIPAQLYHVLNIYIYSPKQVPIPAIIEINYNWYRNLFGWVYIPQCQHIHEQCTSWTVSREMNTSVSVLAQWKKPHHGVVTVDTWTIFSLILYSLEVNYTEYMHGNETPTQWAPTSTTIVLFVW